MGNTMDGLLTLDLTGTIDGSTEKISSQKRNQKIENINKMWSHYPANHPFLNCNTIPHIMGILK